jgi:hypothetical protein
MSRAEQLCTKLPRAPVLRYYHLVDTHLLITFMVAGIKATFHDLFIRRKFFNDVTSPYRDKYTLSAENKVTAARGTRL